MALYVRSDHVLFEGSSTKRSFTTPADQGTAGDEEGREEQRTRRGGPGGLTARGRAKGQGNLRPSTMHQGGGKRR